LICNKPYYYYLACVRNLPTSRGQRLIILHAGGSNGWVEDALFLSCKKISVASADYHFDMDAKIFEEWFEQKLLPNLPKNSVIVMDNAPYHSRQALKIPCMSTKKCEILDFMKKKNLQIPQPCPTKPKLLDIIKSQNFEKEYVVDGIAAKYGHFVLRLPPYFCVFNPIEIIWSIIKGELRKLNCDPFNTNNVCELLRKIVKEKVNVKTWENCIRRCKKFEDTYRSRGCEAAKSIVISVADSDVDSD